MANIGDIRGLLGGIPDPTTRRILVEAFELVMGKGGLTFGDPDHQRRATNFRATYQAVTTATSTGEFSLVHGMESAPTVAIPVLDVGQPGAQLVSLQVTRAADSKRIYLTSPSTGARVTLLVE